MSNRSNHLEPILYQSFNCVFVTSASNYRVLFHDEDADIAELLPAHLDDALQTISRFFSITCEIDFINVFICHSRTEYDSFVQPFTRIPTKSTRIAQPQGNDICLISPNQYRLTAPTFALETPPYYDKDEFKQVVIHETVHLWEESVSPKSAMDRRPIWFSEGMAIFLSGEYRTPRHHQYLINQYRSGIMTDLDKISGEQAYTWGSLLFNFLLKEYGCGKILNTILKSDSENIIRCFTEASGDFIDQFQYFAENKIKQIIEMENNDK